MKKLNVTQLKSIKKQAEEAFETYKDLKNYLNAECFHPENWRRTNVSYRTDTLGNNGYSHCSDYCSICMQDVGSYYEERPKFEVEDKYPIITKIKAGKL